VQPHVRGQEQTVHPGGGVGTVWGRGGAAGVGAGSAAIARIRGENTQFI